MLSSALKRRISAEPIQYILGKTEFMGFEFKVTPDVLIPRQETEILVETAVKYVAASQSHNATSINILDLGTGSGCIAISLAKLLPNAKITATDISDRALAVALRNAELNGVKVNFIQSDLFHNYNLEPDTYNLIVSNPPYIPTAQMKTLQPEVRYEPGIALDGGRDGLDFYRRIIGSSALYLEGDGFLILEAGFNQRDAIENIFQKARDFKITDAIKDYNHIDRVIVAQKLK